MSAEVLRAAARLMRELAEVATAGRWDALIDGVYVGAEWDDHGWLSYDALVVEVESDDDEPTADAEHIASWHPAVALAVADWLEAEADSHHPHAWDSARLTAALTVARTYLGAT